MYYVYIYIIIYIYIVLSFPAPNSLETKAIAKGAEVSAWSSSAHSHGPPAVWVLGCAHGISTISNRSNMFEPLSFTIWFGHFGLIMKLMVFLW